MIVAAILIMPYDYCQIYEGKVKKKWKNNRNKERDTTDIPGFWCVCVRDVASGMMDASAFRVAV